VISARSPLAAALLSPVLTKFTEQLPVPGAIDLTGGGSPTLAMAPGRLEVRATACRLWYFTPSGRCECELPRLSWHEDDFRSLPTMRDESQDLVGIRWHGRGHRWRS
jgi:hypothetical protein